MHILMLGAIPPLTLTSSQRGAELRTGYVFVSWCLVKHRDNFTFTFSRTHFKSPFRSLQSIIPPPPTFCQMHTIICFASAFATHLEFFSTSVSQEGN